MQRVVVAVLASTLVAAGIIALTNVLIHARHPPPPLGTLAWLEPLSCGGWGASARADGYSLRCRSVGTNLTMAEPTSASERISPAACAAFCETTAADAGSGHAWCCQLTAGGESPACAWAEGYPELAETGAGVRSRAYSPCSERLGEAEGLSARRTYSEYACPAKKMQDAMKMDGDAPGTCSQICLPHWLWHAAEGHGVTHGHCADRGCSRFEYVNYDHGVPYNVYAC